jgi:uncharacterized protein
MTSSQNNIIEKAKYLLQSQYADESTGHDWLHLERVLKNAITIHQTEGGDYFLIVMGALLHDVTDYKLNDSESEGADKLLKIFAQLKLNEELQKQILKIIEEVSFSGGYGKTPSTIEAKIVQDADRLDALGAIGIARAFAYGGKKNRLLYQPDILPQHYKNKLAYQKSNAPTINHFFEKLLKLMDLFNTQTAKQIAQKRHEFMLQFLDNFFEETGLDKSKYKII